MYLQSLETALNQYDPHRNWVTCTRSANQPETASIYTNADLFVFASSCESFGLPLLEAMASGLPIACSNRSGLPDLLGQNGTFFDPDSHSDIAAAILTLLLDPPLRTQFANQANERARLFTWEEAASSTLSILLSSLQLH